MNIRKNTDCFCIAIKVNGYKKLQGFHMTNKILSTASIQSIQAILSFLNQSGASTVLWVRSADYERQLYISPTYQAIWKRSCESIYSSPQSWFDTLYKEDLDKNIKDFSSRKESSNSNLTLFRIHVSGGRTKWIKDYSFSLYDI
ncbi:MAG: PAS domain-containing protein, partial [Acinetobacter sp.]|nr:PAS domain-containing protein [Acinetobacter sp.]